jgi:hypothetical protein
MVTHWLEQLWTWLFGLTRQPLELHEYSRRVLLDSDVVGIPFRGEISLVLTTGAGPSDGESSPGELLDLLKVRAAQVTGGFCVVHQEEAEAEVNARLTDDSVSSHGAQVRVRLDVDPDARESALRHLQLRRAGVLRDEKYRAQKQEWDHLRDHVLQDPVTARLWWLDGNVDRLERMADLDELFQKVSRQLVGSALDPKSSSAEITHLIETFLTRLRPEEQSYLVQQVERVFRSFEHDDLAQALVATTSASWSSTGSAERRGIGDE